MAYRVDTSATMRDRLRELYAEAHAQGRGGAVLRALRNLHDRLVQNPLDVGEIVFHIPSGAPVHADVEAPLATHFVIYETTQAVCIVRADLLSPP